MLYTKPPPKPLTCFQDAQYHCFLTCRAVQNVPCVTRPPQAKAANLWPCGSRNYSMIWPYFQL